MFLCFPPNKNSPPPLPFGLLPARVDTPFTFPHIGPADSIACGTGVHWLVLLSNRKSFLLPLDGECSIFPMGARHLAVVMTLQPFGCDGWNARTSQMRRARFQ